MFLACLALALLAWPLAAHAQSPSGAGAGAQQAPPPPPTSTQDLPPAPTGQPPAVAVSVQDLPPATRAQQPLTPDQVIDRIVAQEQAEAGLLRQYSPLVETYIQYLRPDK